MNGKRTVTINTKLVAFTDTNGKACTLQKSSDTLSDKIWLGTDKASLKLLNKVAFKHGLESEASTGWMDYPIPEDVVVESRMHLTRETVKELLPYLINFVETGELKL